MAVTPGNAKTSLLYQLVTHEKEPAMPFKAAKLSKETIALVELWINLGARIPASQGAAVGGKQGGGSGSSRWRPGRTTIHRARSPRLTGPVL